MGCVRNDLGKNMRAGTDEAMRLDRRSVLAAGVGALLCGQRVAAAEWPEKALRITIGYPPGGATDGVARPLLGPMSKALGQPVIMEYKPGAGGATAAEAVARSAPDGYLVHLIEGSVYTALPHLRKLGFDPVRVLQPIGMVAVGGVVIVAHPSLGLSSVRDLINLAKANPGTLAYGTSGTGGAQHLAAEYFQTAAGIKLQHIPYKGGAPAMNDLLGGQIKVLFSSMTPAVPIVKAGKVNALGVTSSTRSSSMPDVATIAEQAIPGFEAAVWLAVSAPAGLPEAVLRKLSTALATAAADPDVQSQIKAQGYEPSSEGPDEVAQRIRKDSAKWAGIIKDARISLE